MLKQIHQDDRRETTASYQHIGQFFFCFNFFLSSTVGCKLMYQKGAIQINVVEFDLTCHGFCHAFLCCVVDPAVRSCPPLSRPQHGFLRCGNSGVTHRMECQVGCERGYRLEGLARLACQADSQWSGPQPRCVGKPHLKSLSSPPCHHIIASLVPQFPWRNPKRDQ